jgi:hypothetical protein
MVKHLFTKLMLFPLLFFWGILSLQAQTGQVTGVVTDVVDGSTLPGATVVVKGTTTGTVTDIDGKYSIEVGPNTTLIYSYIGYVTQEIVVQPKSTVNVALITEATGLDVDVIGDAATTGYIQGAIRSGNRAANAL